MTNNIVILCVILLACIPIAFALKSMIKGFIRFLYSIIGVFVRIKHCSCGEKIISVACCDDGFYLICQNHKCKRSTETYPTIYHAKKAWNEGI